MVTDTDILLVIGSPPTPNDPYLGVFYNCHDFSVNFRSFESLDDVPDESYLVPLRAYRPQHSIDVVELPDHLKNIKIINSTAAGTQLSTKLYHGVIKPLLDAFRLDHTYIETVDINTVKNEARNITGGSTIVFLSGDTSVHELINSLAVRDNQAPLYTAVIPVGTGNALASSIGHKDIPAAISSILRGSPKPLSTFRVEFPDGSRLYAPEIDSSTMKSTSIQALVVASWAFHAAIVADSDTPQYRKLGRQRFTEAANDNISRDQLYRAHITSHGQALTTTHDHSYLLFTTVTNLEPTFCISPHGTPPDDSRIHMVEMPHIAGSELMEIMMKVYDESKHIEDDRVVYKAITSENNEPAVEVEILTQKNPDESIMRWCIDGKIVFCGSKPGAKVQIFKPQTIFRGWSLFIIV